jgi:hypothetical protein
MIQLRSAAHARWPTAVKEQVFHISILAVPATPENLRAQSLVRLRLTLPPLLNLPSGFVGLGIRNLSPKGMLPDFWRSISWPLVGVIFWWITGRGIEALVASRSRVVLPTISWVETIVALFVSLLAGGIAVGLIVDPSWRSDFIFPWQLGIAASCLWIFLGVVTVLARFVQWRITRHMRTEGGQTSPA